MKYVSKELRCNCCHICGKAYSEPTRNLFGKLFDVPGSLVGAGWFHSVSICASCAPKQVAKLKKQMDEMLVEIAANVDTRRVKLYHPPKKTKLNCPYCEHEYYLEDNEEICDRCGEDIR